LKETQDVTVSTVKATRVRQAIILKSNLRDISPINICASP
jgi:hypothetical protein